ncbi:AraC family transcriptional regulator [Flavitalea flava]
MKPILEHLPKADDESFVVRDFTYNYYPTPWHFHPEYEIVLVTESTGRRFIGDNISSFRAGNLALIGSNLPHLYRNDASYYAAHSQNKARAVVVHFSENSFGDNFLSLPEAQMIRQLLVKSRRGLDVSGRTNKQVADRLVNLSGLSGFDRYLELLKILQLISESQDLSYISGEHVNGGNEKESERMNDVLNFVIRRFSDDINVAEAAKVANMAETSFCRFFKQRTRKTFSNYLTEVRMSHAARLLIESDKAVLDICYECGFNNLSNFHRYFKVMHALTPLQYRMAYLDRVK